MGNELAQWRAAIGSFFVHLAPARTQSCASGSRMKYPFQPPDDTDPSEVRKALNKHFRFALIASMIVPRCPDQRKEFFNGLVRHLLLLEAGIEPNPGPRSGSTPDNSVTEQPSNSKRFKTLDSFFKRVPGGSHGDGSPSVPVPLQANTPVAAESKPEVTTSHGRGVVVDCFSRPSDSSSSTSSSAAPRSHEPESPLSSRSIPQDRSSISTSVHLPYSCMPNDIGNFIGQSVSDNQKVQLVENPWQPPPDYDFPYSMGMKNGKEYKRYIKHSHLQRFSWLVFSHALRGFFCKYCPLFAVGHVGGGQKTVTLQKLVTVPLTNFKDLLGTKGDLLTHENHTYHKAAVEAGKRFIHTYHNPESDVLNQINHQRLSQIMDNRERLVPIVRALLFLGRQGLAMRGHRDDGTLLHPSSRQQSDSDCSYDSVARNEGNFREILRLMVDSGDDKLKSHLETASSRATYISKTTQNELIECIGEEILDVILKQIQNAVFYSVIFDETSDISHMSQLSLVIRYVTPRFEVFESFIGFVNAFDDLEKAQAESVDTSDGNEYELQMTGKNIGEIVLRSLRKLGLSFNKCVGIGTDGCSVMQSELKGAVKVIQEECKNALRTPCFNHKLNLSISKSSSIPCIRHTVGTMKECINFFESPKRCHVLSKKLEHKLSGLCETRWIERHDGVLQFSTDLPKILDALDVIGGWADSSTSSKAFSLRAALSDTSFLLAVTCLSDILALTLPLSRLLQKKSLTLDTAANEVSSLLVVLERRRVDSTSHFATVWRRAVELAQKIDLELKVPRLCSRQGYRPNYATDSDETYFRLSIYNPLLDHVIVDLRERFPPEVLNVFSLPLLLPVNILGKSDENLEQLAQKLVQQFSDLLPTDSGTALLSLRGELQLWREKWKKVDQSQLNLPLLSSELLELCDQDVYPSIWHFLKLLTTLPISNASAERSFSALRRLKDWLRSVMSENRLNGLALMLCHRDIEVSIDNVITRFAKCKSRRVDFVV